MSDSTKRLVQAAVVSFLLLSVAGVFAFRSPATVSASKAGRHSPVSPATQAPGLVESFLRQHANDPGSVEIQRILYSRPENKDGVIVQSAWVQFRERNEHGAKVFRQMIVTIENGRHVSHTEFDRVFLPIANSIEWSADPAGP